MEFKMIKKICLISGTIFIIVSIIELIFSMILASTSISFNGMSMTIMSLLSNAALMPLESVVLFIFLNIIICCFLLLGLILTLVVPKKKIDFLILSKSLVLTGMLIIILTFVKLEYVFLLANRSVDSSMTFQALLYDPTITPSIIAFIWIFYLVGSCSFLVIGLIVPAVGLTWTLQLDKRSDSKDFD